MYWFCDAFNMSDNNDGQGKYECPEDHEVFENSFEFGRHARNHHRGTKIKPIINGIEEAPKVEVTRNPQNDFDNLERIMLNAGMAKGVAANVRIIFENYDPQDIDTLEALLRENGINKAVRNLVVATYAAKLGIEIQEPEKRPSTEDNVDSYTEKLVKQRLRRHELYVQARTSGMDNEDLILLFPEFSKKDDNKPQAEGKKKRLFPPDASGTMIEMTDSEYAEMVLEYKRIKAMSQQTPSDIELYKEIGQTLKDAGLMGSARPVKDELQLQMMQSSLRTIESRLNKVTPMATIVEGVIEKLNQSGKLSSVIDGIMNRFEGRKPLGTPLHEYNEADYEKLNAKMSQNENLYQQQVKAEKEGDKPSKSSQTQMGIDHITGKPTQMEGPYTAEKKRLKEEFGMTDDEVFQIMSNVKGQKEMNQIMKKLEKVKNVA